MAPHAVLSLTGDLDATGSPSGWMRAKARYDKAGFRGRTWR